MMTSGHHMGQQHAGHAMLTERQTLFSRHPKLVEKKIIIITPFNVDPLIPVKA